MVNGAYLGAPTPALGLPFNTKGAVFNSLQAAIDDQGSNGEIYVPPGTHAPVTYAGTGITLRGVGRASLIDGGIIGHAVNPTGTFAKLIDIAVQTTPGQGNAFNGVTFEGADSMAIRVTVIDSDQHGIQFQAPRGKTLDCKIEACDNDGITNNGVGDDLIIATSHTIGSGVGGDDVELHASAENNVVDTNRLIGGTIDDNSGTSTVGDNDTT